MGFARLAALAACVLFAATTTATAIEAPSSNPSMGPSGLPVPRFVSLKTEGANGRRGPGLEHRIDWIYQRAGLPFQVTGESGPWRRVRDPGGAQVWIHESNLQGRRTVIVQSAGDQPLRSGPRANSRVLARLAPGVVAGFTGCQGEWRRVTVGGRVGWVPAETVWGGGDCAGL